jgi:hypothetical protein
MDMSLEYDGFSHDAEHRRHPHGRRITLCTVLVSPAAASSHMYRKSEVSIRSRASPKAHTYARTAKCDATLHLQRTWLVEKAPAPRLAGRNKPRSERER